jgi:hypothetical protein
MPFARRPRPYRKWLSPRYMDVSKRLPRMIVGAAAVALMSACGSSSTAVQTSPTPSPSPTPSTLSCTTSGPASASWPVTTSLPASAGIVSATAAGDTFTLTFPTGTPQFEITQQSGTHFLKDPSGLPVDLAGTAGVKITLHGFRGDVQNFTGQPSMTSTGPLLLQVYEIGDFEGVITWAAGLSNA